MTKVKRYMSKIIVICFLSNLFFQKIFNKAFATIFCIYFLFPFHVFVFECVLCFA